MRAYLPVVITVQPGIRISDPDGQPAAFSTMDGFAVLGGNVANDSAQ